MINQENTELGKSPLRFASTIERKSAPFMGFTLMEALIIICVLGIVATLAVPSLQSGLRESKLGGAAEETMLALEYAQLQAMMTGEETRVTVDDTAETVLVELFKIQGDLFSGVSQIPEADVESGSFVTMPHPYSKGKDYLIVLADEDRFRGVDIVNASFGAGNSVTYGALGVPSEGGSVMLALGSKQIILTVNSSTGKVTSSE
jgi:type II secretory pathway pseudopilin PulG